MKFHYLLSDHIQYFIVPWGQLDKGRESVAYLPVTGQSTHQVSSLLGAFKTTLLGDLTPWREHSKLVPQGT